jgi:ankyrin repeat protein
VRRLSIRRLIQLFAALAVVLGAVGYFYRREQLRLLGKRVVQACDNGDFRTAHELLRHGAIVEGRVVADTLGPFGTPRDLKLAEALLEHGASANAKDEWGVPPIALAAMAGPDATRILLAHGADASATLPGRATVLMRLALDRRTRPYVVEVADLLMRSRRPPEINAKSESGTTALRLAAFGGNRELFFWLLEHGAAWPTDALPGRHTFLMTAADGGDLEIYRCVLRRYTSDLDARTNAAKLLCSTRWRHAE